MTLQSLVAIASWLIKPRMKATLNNCIRRVTKDLEVEEDFTALVPLERVQVGVIPATLKDVLMRLSLPIGNSKAQYYDGCSTMVGSKKGVATIIKQSQPNCLLIHC